MLESVPPDLPCLYDRCRDCLNCPHYGMNLANLRGLSRSRSLRLMVNREGIDRPSVDQICTLITRFDSENPWIYSDAVGILMPMSPALINLGRRLAQMRRDWILRAAEIPDYAVACPHLWSALPRTRSG